MGRDPSGPADDDAPPTVTAAAAPGDPDATPATALQGGRRSRTSAPPVFEIGARIDQYVVLDKLGEGGMGTVYAAYDTLLDRKVAVKVVRADRRGALGGLSPRERLLREAQAMARLAHPNVVAVLEVGELADDVFVALEYVDGQTLRAWLRARRRPATEIVAAFVQAGRGLAAAHAAGLVHRDFKPDNVLVRQDGRIQVTDFGVAGMGGAGRDAPSPSGPSDSFTYAGLRVGTPAYMAPEQHAGGAVDARADQFAFCVALWEALYGERPFTAPDTAALAEAIRSGAIRPPPRRADVPRWLEAPLRRGLAADPAARWPSLQPLLAELSRNRAAARWRAVTAGAVAAALASSVGLAWSALGRRDAAAAPCRDAERHLEGRWDPATAAALRRDLGAAAVPYAAATAERVVARLDAWSRRWVAARTEACAATRIHGEQSEALLDARMRCLDRRLEVTAELARALTTTEPRVAARAAEAVAELPSLEDCADAGALTAAAPLPPGADARARIAAVEHDLARATAQERTGRYADALAIAAPAADAAGEVGHAPLVGEALYLRGRLELQAGDPAAAAASLTRAGDAAARGKDDATLARTLVELVRVELGRARPREALALATAAGAAATRAGDEALGAELLGAIGEAMLAAGDVAGAEAQLRRAVAAREAALGAGHVRVAQALNQLAGVHERLGRVDDARAGYARALAIAEAELGAGHPAAATTRANLCFLDAAAGRLDEARACQEEVVATLTAALGPDHPRVAWAINDVALIQKDQGDVAGARARFEQALAIWEAASGPDHPDVAWPLVNLGAIALEAGDRAAADARCRRALAIVEAALGADHPDTAEARACVAAAAAPRPR